MAFENFSMSGKIPSLSFFAVWLLKSSRESCAFLSTNEPSVRPVLVWWKWDLRGLERARWYIKVEVALLFFDPTGHGRARNATRASETAQTAAFLIRMQDLLAAMLTDRYWGSDFPGCDAHNLDSDTSVCHWGHDHRAPMHHFHSGDSEG